MRLIVPVVAALAHSFEVVIGTIFWLMIEMRDRKNYQTARPLGRFKMALSAPPGTMLILM